MKAHLKMISSMVLEGKHLQVEMCILGNGSMAKNMAKVSTSMQMESITKEIGRTTEKMALADLNGRMAPGTKETSCKAISTVKENACMQTAQFMKVISTTINWRVTELSLTRTQRNTLVNF